MTEIPFHPATEVFFACLRELVAQMPKESRLRIIAMGQQCLANIAEDPNITAEQRARNVRIMDTFVKMAQELQQASP